MNRKLLVILVLIVLVSIVAYRFRGWEFDWTLFFASFRDVRFRWLAAGIVATFATYLIRAFRWQILLGPLKVIGVQPLFAATLLGFATIYLLGRAGEVVRPLWITRREHVSLSGSVATIVVERFLDSMLLVLMFASTLLVVTLPENSRASEVAALMTNVAWGIVLTSLAVLIVLFVFRSNIDRIVGRVPLKRVASLLHNFAQGLTFLQHGRSFWLVILHSVLLWIVIGLQFWFMMIGMHFNMTYAAATLVMVGAAIGSIAQVPGIGGGFQAGFVFCLGTFFNIPAEKAVAASLIAWVFSYAPTIALAALYMLFTGLSFRDLRVQTVNE